jgi:hypothetical protein
LLARGLNDPDEVTSPSLGLEFRVNRCIEHDNAPPRIEWLGDDALHGSKPQLEVLWIED